MRAIVKIQVLAINIDEQCVPGTTKTHQKVRNVTIHGFKLNEL